MKSTYTTRRAVFSRIALLVLLTATLRAHSDVTVTYISVEPIPSQDVIGGTPWPRSKTPGIAPWLDGASGCSTTATSSSA